MSSSYPTRPAYKPAPVRGTLLIDQRPGGSATTVPGQGNVTLLGFDVTSGNQDVMLTRLIFRIAAGSSQTGGRYLLVLTDSQSNRALDRIVGEAVVEGSLLHFRDLAVALKQGLSERFEVRTDFRRGVGTDAVRVSFATDQQNYAQAYGIEDGRDLSGIDTDGDKCGGAVCRIFVRTTTSPTLTSTVRGSLYVTKDTVTVPGRQVLLGSTSDPLLRLTFLATGEDVLVTRLTIGGATGSVDRLELLEDGDVTPLAIARGADCPVPATGVFCTSSSEGVFRVMKDRERRIVVRAVAKADTEGGNYGDIVALTLSSSVTDPAVHARGAATSDTLSQTDDDGSAVGEVFIGRSAAGANVAIVGPTHDVVAAKITAIEDASPDPDGSPVPSGAAAIGNFRFRVAPSRNTRNGVLRPRIKTLRFTVLANGVTLGDGSFVIYNRANPGATSTCENSAITGTFIVTCQNLHTSSVGTSIDPGSFIDLALRAEVAPSGSSNRSLQVSLGQIGDRDLAGAVVWEDGAFPFEWVDVGSTQVKSTFYRG